MIYFDAAYILKCYLPEPHCQLVRLYSNDHHLLAAAPHFGLVGRNVIP